MKILSEVVRLRGIIERRIDAMRKQADDLEEDTLVSIYKSIYNHGVVISLRESADRLEGELNER